MSEEMQKIAAGAAFDKISPLSRFEAEVAGGLLQMISAMAPPVALGVFAPSGGGKSAILLHMERMVEGRAKYSRWLGTVPPGQDKKTKETMIDSCPKEPPRASVCRVSALGGRGEVEKALACELVILDDMDRLASHDCLELASWLREVLDDPQLSSSKDVAKDRAADRDPRTLVIAADVRRLSALLREGLGSDGAAESLLAAVVSQRYYLPAAPAGDVVTSLWPEETTGGGRDRESSENRMMILSSLLRAFALQSSTANLRRVRQVVASLRYFAVSYSAEAMNQTRQQVERLVETDAADVLDLKVSLVGVVGTTLLVTMREALPEVYLEWYSHRDELEPLMDFLETLERAFCDGQAGVLPVPEKSEQLRERIEVLDGRGFEVTAREARGQELIRRFRDWRSMVLASWISPRPSASEAQDQLAAVLRGFDGLEGFFDDSSPELRLFLKTIFEQ